MKRTLVHAINRYLGLSETFIYEYLVHIRTFNQLIVTNRMQNFDLFPFPEIITDKDIRRFSKWWFINTMDYYLHRQNGYFENISYIRHQLRKNRARLIHAHFGPQGVKMLPLAKELKIPLVTTFYGYDVTQLPRNPRWRSAYRHLFVRGDLFLVEGNVMRERLLELGCPAHKISIQKIGINMNKYPYRERRLSDKIIFLFCGRFVEKKGLMDALRAFKALLTNHQNLELRIIGDGESRGEITYFINKNYLQKHVKMLGLLPHHRTLQEMQKADILLQPSVTAKNGDTEGGAPTVILEAQASGMLVVATLHADIPNIVAEPIKELLVPERDWEALVKVISTLLAEPGKWPEMSFAGRKFVEQHHDINSLAPQLEQRYQELFYH